MQKVKISTVLVVLSLFTLSLAGCGGCKNDKVQNSSATLEQIEVPKPPAMMAEEEKPDYLAKRYWTNFDFTDTTYVSEQEILEQFFANYINLLLNIPKESAVGYVKKLYQDAEQNKRMFEYFVELGEKYLYDPNSPYRNEELYIPILERVIESDSLSDLEKVRSVSQYEMTKKNRVGDRAANFNITLADGSSINLYGIKGDYLLLYFVNPGCSGCAQESAAIVGSSVIAPMVEEGTLKMVLVYPDEDLEAWRDDLDKVPQDWIYGYDKEQKLRDGEMYDLRAIPTFYLLDKNKNVLIKDAKGAVEIEYYLYYALQNG